MALFGPRLTGDADITGIVDSIRSQTVLVDKTANFNILTKEAETYQVTTGTLTATAPAADSTDLKIGSKFLIINNGGGTLTINQNASGTIGTIAAGESGLLVLLTNATTNGTWQLIQLDRDATGVTKFSETFTTTDWSVASGGSQSIVFNASTLVSANPVVQVMRDSDNAVVLVETLIASTSSITLRVPVITGVTTVFQGRIVVL